MWLEEWHHNLWSHDSNAFSERCQNYLNWSKKYIKHPFEFVSILKLSNMFLVAVEY